MFVPCRIQIVATPSDMRNYHAVYSHSDAFTHEIKFIGATPLHKLLSMEDARLNTRWLEEFSTSSVDINVYGLTTDEREAYLEMHRLIKEIRPICNLRGVFNKPGNITILCIETGEKFQNARECAAAHNLSYSQLYYHLNGRRSFNSVKGRHYKRLEE